MIAGVPCSEEENASRLQRWIEHTRSQTKAYGIVRDRACVLLNAFACMQNDIYKVHTQKRGTMQI